MRLGESCQHLLRHDRVADITNRSHPGGKKHGQHFIRRDMRVIEFVDEVNMGIYKAGNNEFTMQVEHLCATWKLRQTGVLTDPFDAFAPDDKALVWHHDPTSRVEERRVAKYKIVRRTIF